MKRKIIILSIALAAVVGTFFLFIGPSKDTTKATNPSPIPPTTSQPPQTTPTAELEDIIKTTPHTLVDVRTPAEYATAHIENAINLPHDQLATLAETALPDKTAKIIVYCQSGTRSSLATKLLQELGYTDISDLGGIDQWQGTTTTGATP